MRNLIHRLDIFLRHRRIEIGLRWLMVQMWFHKIGGVEYPYKSYTLRLKKLVNDLQDLTKFY